MTSNPYMPRTLDEAIDDGVGRVWLEGMRRSNASPTFQSLPSVRFDDGIPERKPVPGDSPPRRGEGVPCVLSKAKRRP